MKRVALTTALLVLVAGGALALRLGDLDVRPVHVDEAVHAYKFNILWETGVYEYDLREYHGPTIYYAALPLVRLSGARDFAEMQIEPFRLVAVLVGVGAILLLLLMLDGLGRGAALIAAILMAVSPAMVFYSRYYIQEMALVFVTLLVIAAGWRFARSGRVGWAILCGAGIGLMHATKETCVIAWGCMAAAIAVVWIWGERDQGAKGPRGPGSLSDAALDVHRAKGPRGPGSQDQLRRRRLGNIALGLIVAGVVSVVLFSGVGTNWAGPWDSILAYWNYFERAGEAGVHVHPWHYYARMLLWWRDGQGPVWTEGFIVLLALVGSVAIVRGRTKQSVAHRGLLRFLVVYAWLLAVVYSAISYKTPWCLLSFLSALTLLAGVGVVTLWNLARIWPIRVALVALLAAGVGHLAWQAERATSFRYCASPHNPYVYATTLHAIDDVRKQMERLAAVHPDGRDMLVRVYVENCWPLPWYLRDFTRVGYWDAGVPAEADADVVLAAARWDEAVRAQTQDEYTVSLYGFRRDESLVLFVEDGLWRAFVEQQRAKPMRDAE